MIADPVSRTERQLAAEAWRTFFLIVALCAALGVGCAGLLVAGWALVAGW